MDVEALKRLAHYCHSIPLLGGQSVAYVAKNYPGWDWNDFIPRLWRKNIIQSLKLGDIDFIDIGFGQFISTSIKSIEFIPQKNGVRVKINS
ncbi:hypothetical protein MCEMKE14_00416 [Candidatus Nanopelagicaceae bacterium]